MAGQDRCWSVTVFWERVDHFIWFSSIELHWRADGDGVFVSLAMGYSVTKSSPPKILT